MKLQDVQKDALKEVVNIGVGRAAASLSQLLATRIELTVTSISLLSEGPRGSAGTAVLQAFDGQISGKAVLSFPTGSGEQLARVLGESDNLSTMERTGILVEVGNIVLNGVLGSISNMIQADLNYTVPDFFVGKSLVSIMSTGRRIDQSSTMPNILVADTHFCVEKNDIYGSIFIAFEIGSLESLINQLVADASTPMTA